MSSLLKNDTIADNNIVQPEIGCTIRERLANWGSCPKGTDKNDCNGLPALLGF